MQANGGSGGSEGQPPNGPPLPEQIDRYRVKRRLGRGGQASVYLAYDPNLDIDVAVKLLDAREGDHEFSERFRTEARAAVRLTHPHIVRVFDYNPDFPYIAMEYCDGGDLTEQIKRREPRSLRQILTLVRQICDALAAAHDNVPPILHRDLKPANVLFQRNQPKVADFGLAKMLGDEQALTTLRGMMGTIRYMSPEQCHDASEVDARSDLWSLGVILYELLSWTRPFDKPGDSFVNIALKIRLEEARPLPFDLPAPVQALLDRTLNKTRGARIASATAMIAALDGAISALGDEADASYPPEDAIDELDRLAAEGARLLDDGEAERAEGLISELRRRAPDHSLGPYWMKRLRTLVSSSALGRSEQRAALQLGSELDAVESLRGKGDLSGARARLVAVLAQDPGNSVALRLRDRIERELRERTVGLEAESQVPGLPAGDIDPRLADELGQARERLSAAVSDAGARLAQLGEGGDLDGARAALDAARSGALRVLTLAIPDSPEDALRQIGRESERLTTALSAFAEARERDEQAFARTFADARTGAEGLLAQLDALPESVKASRGGAPKELRAQIARALSAAETDDEAGRRDACAALRALEVEARGVLRTLDLEVRSRLDELLEQGVRVHESWPDADLLARIEEGARLSRSAESGFDALSDAQQGLAAAVSAAQGKSARALSEAQAVHDELRRASSSEHALGESAAASLETLLARLGAALESARASEAAVYVESARALARSLELEGRWSAVSERVAALEPDERLEKNLHLVAGGDADALLSTRQELASGESRGLAHLPSAEATPATATEQPWVTIDGKAIASARPGRGRWWLGPAALAALLLVVALGAGFLLRPEGQVGSALHPVFLVAPERSLTVSDARREGEPVPSLEGPVSAEGRRVELKPGRYEFSTEAGSHAFEVPGASALVLTSRDEARWGAILDALDLDEPGQAP